MPYHEIHSKAFTGDTEAITKLLAFNPKIINVLNDNNETPIFLACHAGCVSAVELLIKNGADLSISENHKITPLHRVIGIMSRNKEKNMESYYKIVEIILQKDIHFMAIRDQDFEYPIYKLRNHKEGMDRVVSIIKKLGTVSQVLPVFIEDLQHRDFSMQESAIFTLRSICTIIPETSSQIIPALISAVQKMHPVAQQRAVQELGEICVSIPETSSQIIPALIKLLDGDNVVVKQKVADTLGNIGKFILPQKIFEIIGNIVQSLVRPGENLSVKKHVVDTLVSICAAIPEITPYITNTFKNSLETKSENDELKIYIIISLQRLCQEMAGVDMKNALEIGMQIKPMFEQALRNESLSLTFKQQVGHELAKMYIAIPNLESKKTQPRADKIAAEPVVSNPLSTNADGHQTKCEQETSLRSDSFSASSSGSSSPLSPRFFDSQKQPLLGLTHRNVPATTPSDDYSL